MLTFCETLQEGIPHPLPARPVDLNLKYRAGAPISGDSSGSLMKDDPLPEESFEQGVPRPAQLHDVDLAARRVTQLADESQGVGVPLDRHVHVGVSAGLPTRLGAEEESEPHIFPAAQRLLEGLDELGIGSHEGSLAETP